MLDNIFIRAFLLLALYSSRVIMCSLTSLVVEWRVCLSLQLPYDTGIFHVAKSLPSFACHPSSLFNIWWWRLHRTLTWPAGVLCELLYMCGRSHCLRLQRNSAAASNLGASEARLRLSKTVSWGTERTSDVVQKPQAQHLSVLAGNLVRHAPSVVWLNICFVLLSCWRSLLGCCCPSHKFLPLLPLMEVWRIWRN